LTVAPGDILTVGVGGQGSSAINAGGANGADDATHGRGGGATVLKLGGATVAVAGGGGGGGNAGWSSANQVDGGAGGSGGSGGGAAGVTVTGGTGPYGGSGGTAGAGGSGGGGCFPASAGNSTTGQGGAANNYSGSFAGAGYGGGGGGGATIGGGGGAGGVGTTACQQNWNGGGGGGAGGVSSTGALLSASATPGVVSGDGSAVICLASPTYLVGGASSGATGSVTLQLTSPAGLQPLVVPANTSFTFPTELANGAAWSVGVISNPSGQQCAITPPSGSIAGADVTNLVLSCTTMTVDLAPTSLADGQFSTAYSQTIIASSSNGATAPYTFSASGALPPGITLSTAGVLSGTPAATGSFNFRITALSANSVTGWRDYTLRINPPTIAITPTTLSNGIVYGAYSAGPLSATGGAGPYTFEVTAGSLPAGLSLAGDVITGAPATTGTFNFRVTAIDANGFTGWRDYTLTVAAPVIALTPATLSNGDVFDPYDPVVLSATGGAAPYTFAVTGGALPAGLSLAGGVITGTPAVAGTFNFTVTATDANSFTGSRDYTLTIESSPPIAQDLTLVVTAGTTGVVDLTQGALNAPILSAAIVTPAPAASGTASIAAVSGDQILSFAAAADFAGTVSLTYALTNSDGVSAPATVTITVVARPDPSLDGEVIGLVRAQNEFAKRYANTQITNFNRRLEQLHNEGDRRINSIGVSIGMQQDSDVPNAYASQTDATNDPVLATLNEMMQAAKAAKGDQAALAAMPASPGSAGASPTTMLGYATGTQAKPVAAGAATGGANNATGADAVGYTTEPANPLGQLAIWSGGYINFGTNDDGGLALDSTLVGVSAGADYRFSPYLTAGAGFGYGHDATGIGDNGTESRAQAFSMAVYGSYRPVPGLFLDGLAGYSAMDFDSRRFVTATGEFATGARSGNQIFGSVTAGYEYRQDGLLISPYGRLSGAHSTLDLFSETGAGINSLTFSEQKIDTLAGSLGLRLEKSFKTSWGSLTPNARFEYTHDFEGSSRAAMGYADFGSLPYALNIEPFSRDLLSLELGLDTQFGDIWNLGIAYGTTVGTDGDSQDHTVSARFNMPF
jgi:uncharacterized protein with beta-barrel porin domain